MKIFQKIRKPNGQRQIYFCGIKVFSYNKKLSEYERVFAKRFEGLTDKEIRFCLEEQFKERMGCSLNLDNPKTFNEKLQWLKLYYHRHPNPLLTQCADKVGVREYIKEKIGEEYLIPCLGIWDDPREIDFDKLPNRFVLKVNWGSGQNIIVKDKSKLNIPETIKQLSEWMKPTSNHYYDHFEWCYKDIQPKIIAEKYIEQIEETNEYQFFVFNGKIIFVLIEVNGKYSDNWKRDFRDKAWNKLPWRINTQTNVDTDVPENWGEICDACEKIARPFSCVRLDIFTLNKKLKIREFTFYSGSGFMHFVPQSQDLELGKLLTLPKDK